MMTLTNAPIAKAEAKQHARALLKGGAAEAERGRMVYFLGLRLGELAGSYGYRYHYYG